LTKKLSAQNQQILDSVPDIQCITVAEDDLGAFTTQIKDADALLLSTAFQVTGDVLATAEKLKVISRTGVGVDNVDVKIASEKGILVLNTPDANSISVAEHTVAMIGAISKQLLFYDRELRKGNFKVRRLNLCVDMEGKTLGLIGCGKIGRLVAKKCAGAFGLNAIGYDPFISADLDGIKIYPDIEYIFKNADYISLHMPLTAETKNMVGEKLLSLMKPTAYLINTARGGVVDEAVLARKLQEKAIAGAAFDVLSTEPPAADNPLLSLDNIIITPHSAALTNECTERVAFQAVTGIADYLKGNAPQYVFNKNLL
jgi:D-3-phosphoglycerate dehydrogenase